MEFNSHYDILLPKELIIQLIDFIEDNLNNKILKIEKISKENFKKLKEAKKNFALTEEKFREKMNNPFKKEINTRAINKETNIEMGIKKYFSMIKKNQIEEISSNTEEKSFLQQKNNKENKDEVNSRFWRESMTFKRTKSKPLLTESKLMKGKAATHHELMKSVGKFKKRKRGSRRSLTSFKKKKIEPKAKHQFSLRKSKKILDEITDPVSAKDWQRASSMVKKQGKRERKKISKLHRERRKSRRKSRKRIKKVESGKHFEKKKSEKTKVARWERLYRIGVEKARNDKSRTPIPQKKEPEMNLRKSRRFVKLREKKKPLTTVVDKGKNLPKKGVSRNNSYLRNKRRKKKKNLRKFTSSSRVQRVPAPKLIKKTLEKVEDISYLSEKNDTPLFKESMILKPKSPNIESSSRFLNQLSYTIDSEESDNTKKYFIGLLNHLNPPMTSRRSSSQIRDTIEEKFEEKINEKIPSEEILNIYKCGEGDTIDHKRHRRRKTRGFMFDVNLSHDTTNSIKHLETFKGTFNEEETILRPPLREIKLNNQNNRNQKSETLISDRVDLSYDKEYSENCCSNDFLSFKDNTLKSFEYVENGSICRNLKKIVQEEAKKISHQEKPPNNFELTSSKLNYTSSLKSMQTDTIEEIRIDLELVKKSGILCTDDNALLYSNSNRSGNGEKANEPISERNIFKEKENPKEGYSSENLGPGSELFTKKKSFRKPPTDTSRSNSTRHNESNILEKAGRINSGQNSKNYNTLEKEFLEMSIGEQKEDKSSEEKLKGLEIENMKEFLLASSGSEKSLSRKESAPELEFMNEEQSDLDTSKTLVKNVSLM